MVGAPNGSGLSWQSTSNMEVNGRKPFNLRTNRFWGSPLGHHLGIHRNQCDLWGSHDRPLSHQDALGRAAAGAQGVPLGLLIRKIEKPKQQKRILFVSQSVRLYHPLHILYGECTTHLQVKTILPIEPFKQYVEARWYAEQSVPRDTAAPAALNDLFVLVGQKPPDLRGCKKQASWIDLSTVLLPSKTFPERGESFWDDLDMKGSGVIPVQV